MNNAYSHIQIGKLMDLINLFKVFSNPVRFRILNLLAQRYPSSLCVCDFMELLDCSQSMISRHFKQLRDLKLVTTEQKDQWVHYRLNKEIPKNRLALLKACLQQAAAETPYKEDITRLKTVKNRC